MDLESLRVVARAALQNLEANRQRIDDLNVYPVPDGDTGTNLVLTLRRIVETIEDSSARSSAELASEVSRVALRAGKGNSGVIFSQIVRGAAAVLGEDGETLTVPVVSDALRAGSDAAYRAVSHVGATEGTILTVIREMAEEAEQADPDGSIAALATLVLARGEDALRRTPEMLEILQHAGVVDSGGAGLVEIARGVTLSLNGQELPSTTSEGTELGYDAVHQELSRYRYCTGFVVEGGRLDQTRLLSVLGELGDSLLVVGDESALKVHVHTDDPGAALSLATAMGAIDEVEIADMYAQTAAREARLSGAAFASPLALETGVVAVAQGIGARAIFASEHATVLDGGQTRNPAVEDLIGAIEATAADGVIVLPNNSNVILAAQEAAKHASKDVRVVPSRSVQAGIAAIESYLVGSSVDDNEAGMLRRLEEISTGDVAIAARDARLDGVEIRMGDYLGRVDEKAVAADGDFDAVVGSVVDALLTKERESLRLFVGEDAPPLARLRSTIESRHPTVLVEVYEGGQPHYPLLLVAE
jgi:DAK2 domain fusion protein YloV